jgi:hypothetical protein
VLKYGRLLLLSFRKLSTQWVLILDEEGYLFLIVLTIIYLLILRLEILEKGWLPPHLIAFSPILACNYRSNDVFTNENWFFCRSRQENGPKIKKIQLIDCRIFIEFSTKNALVSFPFSKQISLHRHPFSAYCFHLSPFTLKSFPASSLLSPFLVKFVAALFPQAPWGSFPPDRDKLFGDLPYALGI